MRKAPRRLAALEANPAWQAAAESILRRNGWYPENGESPGGTVARYLRAATEEEVNGELNPEEKQASQKELARLIFGQTAPGTFASPREVELAIATMQEHLVADGVADVLEGQDERDVQNRRGYNPRDTGEARARRGDATDLAWKVEQAATAAERLAPPPRARPAPRAAPEAPRSRPGAVGIDDAVEKAFAAHTGEATHQESARTGLSTEDAVADALEQHAPEVYD